MIVAGYASYGPWRVKSGYRHTVENSLYVLASPGLHRMVAMIMQLDLDR